MADLTAGRFNLARRVRERVASTLTDADGRLMIEKEVDHGG